MNTPIGPLTTDREFFEEIVDTSLPGLEEIAHVNGDYQKARKIFAAYVRTHIDPKRYFAASGTTKEELTEEDRAEIIATAENGKKHLLTSTGTPCQFGEKVDWFANPTYNKYKEWTWQLSRHHEPQNLAYAYYLTGDESYAEGCLELLESWWQQAVRPEPCRGYDTLCWRTIECGIRMGLCWPEILHCIYRSPAFTDDRITDWYKSVYEHGVRIQRDHTTGNWYIHELNGLSQIGVLYPELKPHQEWLEFAMREAEHELDIQVYPDGLQYELSTGYHHICVHHFTHMAKILAGYGVHFSADFMKKIEAMLEVYVKLMQPNGNTPDLNDGSSSPAKSFTDQHLDEFPENERFRFVSSEKKEGKAPDYTSIALPYSGLFVMRSGWEDDAVWGLFDGGPFGTGHQHEDKLNVLVNSYGKYVLVDAGNFAYDTSEMRKYVLCTRSHNTVRVNGKCQNRRRNYDRNAVDMQKLADLRSFVSDELDYAESFYNEGYGNADDPAPLYTGVEHRRGIAFYKKPGNGLAPFFVVEDRFISEDENLYEILWHLDTDAVQLNGVDFHCKELQILTSENGLDTWGDVLHGQQTPEWQGWKSLTRRQLDWQPLYVARTHAKGSSLRVVSVLYPSRNGECPIVKVEADKDVNADSVTLHLQNGEVLTLSRPVL